MANRFDGKGFTPTGKKKVKQTAAAPADVVQTSTRTVVQAALTTSAAHLQQLEEGMDLVSDQFADCAVAIVKGGIQNCYTKASARIAAIEVEDFFTVEEAASMFAAVLPAVTVAVLPGQADAA